MFSIYKISKDWGEPEKKIEFNAEYLHDKGWVKFEASGGFMRITAEGVDAYEREHEQK